MLLPRQSQNLYNLFYYPQKLKFVYSFKFFFQSPSKRLKLAGVFLEKSQADMILFVHLPSIYPLMKRKSVSYYKTGRYFLETLRGGSYDQRLLHTFT